VGSINNQPIGAHTGDINVGMWTGCVHSPTCTSCMLPYLAFLDDEKAEAQANSHREQEGDVSPAHRVAVNALAVPVQKGKIRHKH
jgi:hypothetical protein